MNGALATFAAALFALTLLLLELLRAGWDRQFGAQRQLKTRVSRWFGEPVPLAPPAPPLRLPAHDHRWADRLRPLRHWLQRKRLRRIEAQLPDAVEFLSRALRAGHDLTHAVEMAAGALQDPVAHELKLTAEEIGFGAGLPLALQHLGTRVPLPDLQTFIVATTLHRETGGDITRVFDRLASLMRERAGLRAQIRVLSAEGRLSAWILSVLPVLCAALAQWLHPGLLDLLLQDPVGRQVAIGALAFWVLGIFLMARITDLDPT
ncbi:MAG: type II secretion system F family protein [Betaproteobacteria bacterium]|nr:type II secretion system F family protein [Betaproteobacteria bacterium]MDE1981327.1 type II secretion system F family protein [Betaproteobacteria bacterium]MDE2211823.1 type II secretion system F family protein [Betaproteobacteria bacterium]MDE2354315.1 type II secretion system F family protein [Betaproteobacteria bacterium]